MQVCLSLVDVETDYNDSNGCVENNRVFPYAKNTTNNSMTSKYNIL